MNTFKGAMGMVTTPNTLMKTILVFLTGIYYLRVKSMQEK